MPDADLERFHDGYRRHFDQALSEINGGRKRSHWMWFIFPQVAGLGSSPTAAHYAIRNRAEAEAFLRDPILGPGYRRSSTPSGNRSSTATSPSGSCSAGPTTRSSSRRSPCSPASPATSATTGHDRRQGQRDPRPRRRAGPAALRRPRNDSSPPMLDPDTAPLARARPRARPAAAPLPRRQPRSRRARRPTRRHRRRHARLVDRRPPGQVAAPVRAQRDDRDHRTGRAGRAAQEPTPQTTAVAATSARTGPGCAVSARRPPVWARPVSSTATPSGHQLRRGRQSRQHRAARAHELGDLIVVPRRADGADAYEKAGQGRRPLRAQLHQRPRSIMW